MPTQQQLRKMLGVYGYASQAFWRSFEIDALSRVSMERPILEIGCADGYFTKEVCNTVELGIDINPNAIARAKKSGVFQQVVLQDAKSLDGTLEFRTVLANSVLEHIPNLKPVLEGSFRALQRGGKLVLTVPLSDMNASMLFSRPAWIRYRHDRLSHVNLWSLEKWSESLREAGFQVSATERYLSAKQVRMWDAIDGIAVLGTRRINVGSVMSKITRNLPQFMRQLLYTLYIRCLAARLSIDSTQDGCCALIVATKA